MAQDLAALAAKMGGVSSPTGIDFAKLAQQNGGTSTAPTASGSPSSAPASFSVNPDGTIALPSSAGGSQAPSTPAPSSAYSVNPDGTIALPSGGAPSPSSGGPPGLGVFSNLNDVSKSIAGNITAPMKAAEGGAGAGTVVKDIAESGLNTAGDVAGGIGDFFVDLGKAVIPQPIKDAIKARIAKNTAPDTVAGGAIQEIANLVQKYPQTAHAIGSALNIVGGTQVESALTDAAPALTKLSGSISDAASGVKNALAPAMTSDELAGSIAQGKAEDVPRVKNALSQIDATGVKTYRALASTIGKKIAGISSVIDDALATNPVLTKLSDLAASGKNYVSDALDQLKTFYEKTNDVPGQSQVDAWLQKGNGNGLSAQDINDIAKVHGQDLSGFNLNGETASGLAKQAAENTRAGVKGILRGIMNNPVFEEADSQLSDLLRTKKLVSDVDSAVTKLSQKIIKKGLGEKAVGAVVKFVNTVTDGGLRGLFMGLLDRGQGLKTLNALDLQNMLGKNLTKLQSLLGPNVTSQNIISTLQSMIDDNATAQSSRLALPEPTPLGSSNNPIVTPPTAASMGMPDDTGVPQTVKPPAQLQLPSGGSRVPNDQVISLGPGIRPVIDPQAPGGLGNYQSTPATPTLPKPRLPVDSIQPPTSRYPQ